MRTLAKPEPRRIVNARAQRHAAKVVKSVRAQCVTRDGYCRIGNWEDNGDDWHSWDMEDSFCDGPSEWAHLGDKQRFKTRGMPPEVRHTTAGSLMACHKHHADYDAGLIDIQPEGERGADGPLVVTRTQTRMDKLNALAARARRLKAEAKA